MNYLLDTNIIIYHLKGQLCAPFPSDGDYFISVISELEVLSYPDITPPEEAIAREFLQQLTLVDISSEIKNATITLRRQHRLKLPDAIIAATAINYSAVLLTNDERLAHIPKVRCQTMPIQEKIGASLPNPQLPDTPAP